MPPETDALLFPLQTGWFNVDTFHTQASENIVLTHWQEQTVVLCLRCLAEDYKDTCSENQRYVDVPDENKARHDEEKDNYATF